MRLVTLFALAVASAISLGARADESQMRVIAINDHLTAFYTGRDPSIPRYAA